MAFQITSLYGAILGLLCVALSVQVSLTRVKTKVSLLDGSNPMLTEAIRRHGNFVEYVPIALILMAFAESGGGNHLLMHGLGVLLLAARLIHPFGIKHDNAAAPARIAGTAVSQFVIVVSAGLIIWQHLA